MEQLTSNVTDTALIFEGGGMRASYTSAVVVELLRAGIYLDYVAGISAGSSNTVNYLSRDGERARRSFVEFAADPNFGDLRTFLRGKGLFHAEYIYEQTSEPGQALPLDFDTLQKNPAQMRIGAFRCGDGEMVYFDKEDAPTLRDLVVRVRASSTMPIIMPPVHLDGEVYVDGALGPSGGIALDAAKRDGYTKFLVIRTRARGYVKEPQRFSRALRTHYRKFPAVAEGLLARHTNYNRTVEELEDLERDGKAYQFYPEHLTVSNSERDVDKLMANHQAGLAQARAEIPAIRDFLGLEASSGR